jgi:hypothetical protein
LAPVMDGAVAGDTDHECPSPPSLPSAPPMAAVLPRLAEVGEFADVVDFHVAGVRAHLVSSGPDVVLAHDADGRDAARPYPFLIGALCYS